MRVDEFDYNLPEELIAQTPLDQRDQSSLLVLHRTDGKIEHRSFYNILDYLQESVVIVGAKSPKQVLQNAEALDWTLTQEQIDRLEKISKE